MARALYELLYKLPSTEDDLCEQYWSEIQHECYCRIGNDQKLIGNQLNAFIYQLVHHRLEFL